MKKKISVTRDLEPGDVFKVDNSLYVDGGIGYLDGAMALSIAQNFNQKSGQPSVARKLERLTDKPGNRKFVVVSTETRPSHEEGDDRHRHLVQAKQLDEKGLYDRKGLMISFSQGEPLAFDHVGKVKVTGKMEQTFTRRPRK